eukprot:gene23996-biopygen4379
MPAPRPRHSCQIVTCSPRHACASVLFPQGEMAAGVCQPWAERKDPKETGTRRMHAKACAGRVRCHSSHQRTDGGTGADASRTIGFEETDASRTRPQPFLPLLWSPAAELRRAGIYSKGVSKTMGAVSPLHRVRGNRKVENLEKIWGMASRRYNAFRRIS